MKLVMLFVMMLLTGCGVVQRDLVVPRPESPAFIVTAKGKANISYFDPALNELVFFGKVNISDFEGWTITPFDWASHIEELD